MAQTDQNPLRQVRLASAFLTERTAASQSWQQATNIVFVHQPSVAALRRSLPANSASEFGISFDCAMSPDGGLVDCRAVLATPRSIDATSLVRIVAPMFRIDPVTSARARSKGYRLTVDMALSAPPPAPYVAPPPPCPTCLLDPPPPPPPPPRPNDPVLSLLIDDATRCLEAGRQPASDALFAAQQALHDPSVDVNAAAYRKLALRAFEQRQALGRCIALIREQSFELPIFGSDAKILDVRLGSMLNQYHQLDRGTFAVLGGLLDRQAGEQEEAFPFQ